MLLLAWNQVADHIIIALSIVIGFWSGAYVAWRCTNRTGEKFVLQAPKEELPTQMNENEDDLDDELVEEDMNTTAFDEIL